MNPATLAVLALAAALLTPSVAGHATTQTSPEGNASRTPSLVVILVADQMRADYLERYSARFTGGLARLIREGAWFDRAAYPYLNTITCAGHSTIGTGAFPYRHGMILNTWWDRKTQKTIDCTDDHEKREVNYGTLTGIGDTGRFQMARTLSQQMRDRLKGRTVTMSIKARSAIGLGGRKADVVTWFDERGAWTTSSAYTARPLPWLQAYIESHPITDDLGKTWSRSGELSDYQYVDNRPGERPPTGWTNVFPHVLGVPGAKTQTAFLSHWLRSPFSDEYLEHMVEHAVDTLHLGSGKSVDFLGVSFSALDSTGHNFGPESHEVQDLLVRLDLTIGRLLDHLDAKVGRGRYVVGFSADHGVARIPEHVPGGGRVTSAQVTATVDEALQPILGPGKYLAYAGYTDLYLKPGVYKRVVANPQAVAALREKLTAMPGIERMFLSDEVKDASARVDAADPVRRAAALSHYPGRSGDLIIVPREQWILSTAATTHGTLQPYDQRVPVIFYGAHVAPGRYSGPATPADLAPTLAALAQVPFVLADGRVLRDALADRASTR
jgi:predicted AlkP superfamily pyrophosphatase or phosphodiesterase